MKAGRELDAIVAVRVMGYGPANREWQYFHEGLVETHYGAVIESDPCSTEIKFAWGVVDKLAGIPSCGWPRIEASDFKAAAWKVSFGMFHAEAPTAPLAICRAALLALEGL